MRETNAGTGHGWDQAERGRALLAAVRADRKRLASELDALRDELATVRKELAETESWLQELERSRSWRLTAPLRAISGRLRRRRRRFGAGSPG